MIKEIRIRKQEKEKKSLEFNLIFSLSSLLLIFLVSVYHVRTYRRKCRKFRGKIIENIRS